MSELYSYYTHELQHEVVYRKADVDAALLAAREERDGLLEQKERWIADHKQDEERLLAAEASLSALRQQLTEQVKNLWFIEHNYRDYVEKDEVLALLAAPASPQEKRP